MKFEVIDRQSWSRKEYFEHYYSSVPCTYSMNVRLDITEIVESRHRLYPAMLYAISVIVNRHSEFRTSVNEKGEVGVFSEMIPCYTVFHKKNETFSNIWTEYHPHFSKFLDAYQKDMEKYGSILQMEAKPNTPINTFPVSMIPWTTFEGFNLNLQKGYEYLLPILQWESIMRKIIGIGFHWLFRCIMGSVMVFMYAVLLTNCRNYSGRKTLLTVYEDIPMPNF